MAAGVSTTIESYLPGRMRIRLPHGLANTHTWSKVVVSLGAVGGVLRVVTNAVSRGVLVDFDPEVVEIAEIVAVLEAANIAVDLGLHISKAVLAVVENHSGPRVAQAAHNEIEHLKDMDITLHKVTGGAAGMKLFLPFLLVAVVVVALRHGWLTPDAIRELLEKVKS